MFRFRNFSSCEAHDLDLSPGPSILRRTFSQDPSRLNPDRDNDVFETPELTLPSTECKPASISGRIPLDPGSLMIGFRSLNGSFQTLDFPVDIEDRYPPALSALIAACEPYAICSGCTSSSRDALFYPPEFQFSTTLDLPNYPIVDVIRSSLLPHLTQDQYIITRQEGVGIVEAGAHMCPQRYLITNDGKVATVIVTLPISFKGGTLIVQDFFGNTEKHNGCNEGTTSDLIWTAFLDDCTHEIDTVTQGVRLMMTYSLLVQDPGSFNPEAFRAIRPPPTQHDLTYTRPFTGTERHLLPFQETQLFPRRNAEEAIYFSFESRSQFIALLDTSAATKAHRVPSIPQWRAMRGRVSQHYAKLNREHRNEIVARVGYKYVMLRRIMMMVKNSAKV